MLAVLFRAASAHASAALLTEEPFGEFGAMNPTGHAAIYLDHVCAATPTRLRPCGPGELGIVISRYHKVDGYDWVAIPLVPYLYAVDSPSEVPEFVTEESEAALRDRYRRDHLLALAPDTPGGQAPPGEWIQLIGSSYDRRIYGFEMTTTAEQDARLIAWLNVRRNVGHFNLFFHNCADFSRVILGHLYPDLHTHNSIADFGLTTPKHEARVVENFGQRHPEVDLRTFVIPQVSGTTERSRPVRGIAESLVRQRRYMVPLAVLHPEFTGALLVTYLAEGRFRMPAEAQTFRVDALPGAAPAVPSTASGGTGNTSSGVNIDDLNETEWLEIRSGRATNFVILSAAKDPRISSLRLFFPPER